MGDPLTNERAERIRLVEVQKYPSMGSFKQDQIWYRGKKGIYNFRLFDARTGTLQGITIHYLDRQMNLVMRLDAERGEWKEGRWLFHNVLITRFDSGEFPVLSRMKQQVADLPERPSDFQLIQKDVEAMGYSELKRYIRKLQSEGYDATRYVVDLHGKMAFPLVSILLAVIGVSFSSGPSGAAASPRESAPGWSSDFPTGSFTPSGCPWGGPAPFLRSSPPGLPTCSSPSLPLFSFGG